MKAQLLVAAAGSGSRLGGLLPKALVPLGEAPMLIYTLRRLLGLAWWVPPIITVPAEQRVHFELALAAADFALAPRLVNGGATRQESVARGLAALDAETELVAIHDAARPFVPLTAVEASLEAAERTGAATVALPAIDTILLSDAEGFLESTPDRRRAWACQTPQTFQVRVIRAAHEQAMAEGFEGTDDASLVRRLGLPVKLVAGSPYNLKVTTPEDLALARLILREGLV